MLLGKVIGNVWATRKEDGLIGLKFLMVQPESLEIDQPTQQALIVVDRIGAGVGDKVMVTQGTPASYIDKEKTLPIDALVIGIIDAVEQDRGESGD